MSDQTIKFIYFFQVGQIDLQNFYGFKADFIEDFFSPRKLHIQNEIFIDNKRFISSAVVIRKIEENYFLQDHNEVKKQNGKKDAESDQVLAFTIVLMIENNFDNLQFQEQFYKHQLSFFARCLELEERKNNLLGKQLTKIFKQNMEFSQYVKDLSTNEQIKEIIQNQINNNVEDAQLFKNLQEWIIKQNFETLGMANNFSLEEIEVYVNHILQWKQGVVMNILTQYSVLILKPRMKKSSLQKVIEGLMKQQEDNIDIYGSITNFLVPKIVKEHSKELGISGDSIGQIDEKQKKAMTILSGLDGNIVEILNRYANKQVHLNEIAFNEKVKIQDLQKVIFHSEAQNVFQVYYLED
ncbi:hypothetical protein PPERSA_09428 [Pseudocohnilembus persalinus]|uniref:Uncharacterized protein n=1 Tax=Pseudocohnilembus persalinus TaxID=266149 RepID=A0A0V0QA00_PSEPJ|nr:hypothetical protein PPERSA_09428 [Pseudocohnilembus persalinus]|eukprot:KRW98903.1 hypothetical protein PPERSA_09428 [Pseudocohnilembus persalinus]